jgi:aspartate ammonia-lyase
MDRVEYRLEKDLLGERELPGGALYGIHTLRAKENFPLSGRPVAAALIHAFGYVKLACAQTNYELGYLGETQFDGLKCACREMIDGLLDEHIMVDALQGGAGTSTNMNINEVLANRALQLMGYAPGTYEFMHPLEDVNRHQSTNDTYPTSLKLAAVFGLRRLEKKLVSLLEKFQQKEREFAHVVKVGRTQLQDAVLTTLGRSMAAYAEAIGRDRWRIYKCEERLRVVNLGGTAIGTGVTAPRKYIFKATENLKKLTGIGLARAENLVEATQNCDALVEVSGILNAYASSLLKISGDLRFIGSGPDAGIGEIRLPPRQAGSSLMPGKVNPVIPESVTQAALTVISNNNTIAQAAGMGSLELNPFMPLIADRLLETIQLLTNASSMLADLCVAGLQADEEKCASHIEGSTAVVTALIGAIGYEKAQQIAARAASGAGSVKKIVVADGVLSGTEFDALVSAEAVNRLGFRQSRASVPLAERG